MWTPTTIDLVAVVVVLVAEVAVPVLVVVLVVVAAECREGSSDHPGALTAPSNSQDRNREMPLTSDAATHVLATRVVQREIYILRH